MEDWIEQTAGYLKAWAPLLTHRDALELAADLYRAWPADPPAVAFARFIEQGDPAEPTPQRGLSRLH